MLMFRPVLAQVIGQQMQLRQWLVIGGIVFGALIALSIIAAVYFPRRRRQRGFDFAAVGATILGSAVILGTTLSIMTYLQRRPLINSGWFLVAVFGVLFMNRVLDFLRFRLDRSNQEKALLELGRGAPFLNDTKDLAQLAGILALSGTGVFRFLLGLLLNPNALTISFVIVFAAWLGICLLLNRWTPWYTTERGISVWGGELIEWSEIKNYVWIRDKSQPSATLIMTLDDESQRYVTIKELSGALEQQLKDRLMVHPRDASNQSVETSM